MVLKSIIDALELRDWQSSALKRWIDNGYRGIAEVATAGGKTRFALECAEYWSQIVENPIVVVVVPTTALQDQWAVTISETFNINLNEISTWPEKILEKSKYHVMVVNTAREKITAIEKLKRPIMLIADECHRFASAENSKIFKLNSQSSLGISATAERQYDEGLRDVLIPNLGKIIYEYSLLQATEDKVISNFQLVNIEIPMTQDETTEYGKYSKRIGIAISQGDMEKVKMLSILRSSVSKNAIARIPASCGIIEANKGKRIVVFHEEIESAEKIYETLIARGNLATIYHSKMSPDLRRSNLHLFRRGLFDILVCIRALDEGIDIPEAEIAVIAAATNSHRQRVQRIGRVVRKHSGKELATIYTLYATDSEREILVQESGKVAGVAKVSWLKMGIENE